MEKKIKAYLKPEYFFYNESFLLAKNILMTWYIYIANNIFRTISKQVGKQNKIKV